MSTERAHFLCDNDNNSLGKGGVRQFTLSWESLAETAIYGQHAAGGFSRTVGGVEEDRFGYIVSSHFGLQEVALTVELLNLAWVLYPGRGRAALAPPATRGRTLRI